MLEHKQKITAVWRKYMHEYLSLDIICSSKLTALLELRSRKTVRFSERGTDKMSKEKYAIIFSCQMEAINCVYYPSNIFCNTRIFENEGISSDIAPFYAGNIGPRDAFRPVACERKY